MGAPTSDELAGALLLTPARVPQLYPPIRPQISVSDHQNLLEQSRESNIVIVCSESRKTDRTWSPGNFGCRGLLVYGPLSRRPELVSGPIFEQGAGQRDGC